MSTNEDRRYLVPVEESVTLRNTVAYVLQQAAATAPPGTVHFVVVETTRAFAPDAEEEFSQARELLDRIEIWADEDLGEDSPVTVETAVVGEDRYLFSPGEYAETITEYATANDLDRIVLDPEYEPGVTAPMLRPLQVELSRGEIDVEEAPVERAARRTVLARAGTVPKYLAVFGASFLFYLSLGPITAFNLVTGAATAGVTSLLLAPIAFGKPPNLGRVLRQLLRFTVYGPYLLWEIAKANVDIARVVLHPSLPIDPRMVRFRAAVWGDVPVTTLANSITLTPGTLTVDVSDRAFAIHTLTESARDDLFDGGLERAVRFVFFGRSATRIPSPRERDAGIDRAEAEAARERAAAAATSAATDGTELTDEPDDAPAEASSIEEEQDG